MWFSPDGKTIAVPQGRQLFLVSSETGEVNEKIDVGFYIKGYCAANDRFLLANDTSIFIYDKYTYKLIKRIELPQNLIINQYPAEQLNALSPDGKTIITSYYQKSTTTTYSPEVGIINVEGGNYKKIKDVNVFEGLFSPDGKYFIAYECDTFGTAEPLRVVIYDSLLKKALYDSWGWVASYASNFSFSVDSKLLYFSNNNTMVSVNLADGFNKESINIQGNILATLIPINDTLAYTLYYSIGSSNISATIMNLKSKSMLYKYQSKLMGMYGYISPNKNYMIQLGFDYFFKVSIPYDKLSITDDEITKINNGFTLSPNPFINQANFNIFLKKDQELSYSIYSLDGKEVKRENIGKYGAGYASGALYLEDMTPGTYLIVFSGADKVAQGSLIIKKLGE